MKRFTKPLIGVAAALLLAAVAWVQTPAADAPSEARYLPPGALLTLEARDFAGMLGDWNASPEKQAWLGSDNYQVFSRSKLFFRLNEARGEFAAAAGVPLEAAWLESVAGGESALGVYDIGELRFVYVTRMPEARAVENALWQKRADFEPREAAGQAFYVRADGDSGRQAAFAVVGERLALATDADLLAKTVALLAGNGDAVTGEGWYGEATAPAGTRGELRLVHNLQALVRTPHFRSYWVQENTSALRAYKSGVADLYRSDAAMREQRVLLKVPGDQPRAAAENALGPLLARVPVEVDLYRAWGGSSPEQAVELLRTKLLDPGPSGAYGPYSYAPAAPQGAASVGDEAALETRIDQAPPSRAAETFDPAPLAALFDGAGVKNLLQLQSQRPGPDGALPTNDACVVIELAKPAALEPFALAVSQSAAGLWTTSGMGASWEQDGAIFKLDGLNPLYAWAGGTQLALANSPELLRAALGQRATPESAPTAVFAGGFRHGRARALYRTTMQRIEALQFGGYDRPNREPYLFSENMASLSDTLERFTDVTVERRDLGERVDETVVYARRP
ncbi:MAG: hypothetical protein KDC27_13585 [Acidobacteria bacterium]|nr:hypothetical protein [Acidobacteriota bacterium]